MDFKESTGQATVDIDSLLNVNFDVPEYKLPKFKDPDEKDPTRFYSLRARQLILADMGMF